MGERARAVVFFDSDLVSEGLVLMSIWRGFDAGALTEFARYAWS